MHAHSLHSLCLQHKTQDNDQNPLVTSNQGQFSVHRPDTHQKTHTSYALRKEKDGLGNRAKTKRIGTKKTKAKILKTWEARNGGNGARAHLQAVHLYDSLRDNSSLSRVWQKKKSVSTEKRLPGKRTTVVWQQDSKGAKAGDQKNCLQLEKQKSGLLGHTEQRRRKNRHTNAPERH